MIYLEYIERDRHVPVEVFRYLADQSTSWVEAHADRMVLQLGRTLRFGPPPSYLAFWRIAGLERLDEWEAYFGSKGWYDNARSQAMHRSIHIERAGLYEELIGPPEAIEPGLHLVEFFDAPAGLADAEVARCFSRRAERYPEGRLDLVLRRIGLLGPEPAHLAVWTFPCYRETEFFLAEQSLPRPVELRACGAYRPLGKEIP